MNNKFAQLAIFTSKINRQHIQLVIVLASLAMLVLGIGAPSDAGPCMLVLGIGAPAVAAACIDHRSL